jgi:hypothetical protein
LNEFIWVWTPSLLVILAPWLRKRLQTRSSVTRPGTR